jgi:hypothetical protein
MFGWKQQLSCEAISLSLFSNDGRIPQLQIATKAYCAFMTQDIMANFVRYCEPSATETSYPATNGYDSPSSVRIAHQSGFKTFSVATPNFKSELSGYFLHPKWWSEPKTGMKFGGKILWRSRGDHGEITLFAI